jgi:hypothetical protein
MDNHASSPESESVAPSASNAPCVLEPLPHGSRLSSQKNPFVLYRVGSGGPRTSPPAAGRYLAARNSLGGAGEIQSAVRELRAMVDSSTDEPRSVRRHDLLEVWTSVERSLPEREHRELSAAVFSHLFPGGAAPTISDSNPTLGGY